jgi:hypothetical protein
VEEGKNRKPLLFGSAVEWRERLENFYAKMDKSGRITIPKLTLKLLGSLRPEVSLTGAVMLVQLEPA